MTKDLIICVLSTINILLFSFIGFNYEAFQKLNQYEAAAKEIPHFDEQVWKILEKMTKSEEEPQPNQHGAASENKFYISIPKLNVLAPIKITQQKEVIQQTLDQGVISLGNLLPPEQAGQNILFGHSSDYPWRDNPFGTIFTLLPKLSTGDEIIIRSHHHLRRYMVKTTRITDASLKGIIKPASNHELILSTCYPIGFFNKRYNVIAEPISNTTPSNI